MQERSEVKTDGVPVCDSVPLCVSTVKKAKLDGPQGKTWDPGNRKRQITRGGGGGGTRCNVT